MATRFQFRWIPFLAAFIAAAIGVSLGQWQTRRAHEKEAIEAKLSARESDAPLNLNDLGTTSTSGDVEFRHAIVEGQFVPEWTIFLDNRPYNGRAGFYVLTPLKLSGSDRYVLIARGWVQRDLADRTKVPETAAPPGTIRLQGVIRRHAGRLLQLGRDEPLHSNAIIQNLNVADLAQASGMRLEPFLIEQTSDTLDGLTRDWPRPSFGADKHWGYAFQWYALAATAVIFFLATGFRSGKN